MNEILFARVKKLLAAKKMTQVALAVKLGMDYSNLWRKMTGKRKIDMTILQKIAQELDTSVAFLTGEQSIDSRNPLPSFENNDQFIKSADWKMLPLYNNMTSVCRDAEQDESYTEPKIDSWYCFPSEIYGTWDPKMPPYMLHAEGDGMEDANIHDGAIIVVNPAEEIYDGDSVFVCWNGNEAAVKLLYRLPGGAVELHAANFEHKKIYTFSVDDVNEGKLKIKGKIMWAGQRPKRIN